MSETSGAAAINEAVGAVAKIIEVARESPEAREAGTFAAMSLNVVAKSLYNLLVPLRLWNFGQERAETYFREKFGGEMRDRVEGIPEEHLVSPKPHVARPALQGVFDTIDEDELRSMYLSLLAASMDDRVSDRVHPAFVEIVKQLAPREVPPLISVIGSGQQDHPLANVRHRDDVGSTTLLYNIARAIDHPQQDQPLEQYDAAVHEEHNAWVENWQRLGLVEIDFSRYWDISRYGWVHGRPEWKWAETFPSVGDRHLEVQGGMLRVTAFGRAFARAIDSGRS